MITSPLPGGTRSMVNRPFASLTQLVKSVSNESKASWMNALMLGIGLPVAWSTIWPVTVAHAPIASVAVEDAPWASVIVVLAWSFSARARTQRCALAVCTAIPADAGLFECTDMP